MIQYHWREWLALEQLQEDTIVLECDERYGFDGLNEFAEQIQGYYKAA